jgi:hypothetical protein
MSGSCAAVVNTRVSGGAVPNERPSVHSERTADVNNGSVDCSHWLYAEAYERVPPHLHRIG